MTKLRCGTVQFHHRPNDKSYNFSVIQAFAEKAGKQGVRILAFPEMCITGYWHVRNLGREALDELAEPVPNGPSVQGIAALAAKHRITIGAGLIESDDRGGLFNTYFVCEPSGAVYSHRKLHAFENEHIQPGDHYTVFDS